MLSHFPPLKELSRQFAESHGLANVKFFKYSAAPPPYIMQFRYGRCDEDVILASSFDRFTAARLGALVNLEEMLPPGTFDRLIEPAVAEARRTGSLIELPYLGEVMVLNYNRKLLAAAGIKEPARTWQELGDQATLIKKNCPGVTPVALNLRESCQTYFYYPILLGLAGTCETSGGWPITEGPVASAALHLLAHWMQAGFCNSVGEDGLSLFRAGQAAYFVSWASHGAMGKVSLGEDAVDFVPLAGPALTSFHRGDVPKTAWSPELASQYLCEVMLSPEMQKAIYDAGKIGVLKADYDSGKLPAWAMSLREQLKHGSIGPTAPVNMEKLERVMHNAIQGVAIGSLSVEQAMQEMTRELRLIQERANLSAGGKEKP